MTERRYVWHFLLIDPNAPGSIDSVTILISGVVRYGTLPLVAILWFVVGSRRERSAHSSARESLTLALLRTCFTTRTTL